LFYYTAYGLRIGADIELPEFVPSSKGSVDVAIRRGKVERMEAYFKNGIHFKLTDDGLYWVWEGVAAYRIRGGREIVFDPEEGAEAVTVRQPLYGVAIAAILQHRGFLVLHGSAVEINGRAIVLVGDKGSGKSTLAIALEAQGHRLLTDDITAVSISMEQPPYVPLGVPAVKLWPDSIKALGMHPDDLPRLSSGIPKRIYSIDRRGKCRGAPLGAVVILGYGKDVELKELQGQERFLGLVAGQYFVQIPELLPKPIQEREFRYCVLLSTHYKILRLSRPYDLGLLPEVVTLLEQLVIEK